MFKAGDGADGETDIEMFVKLAKVLLSFISLDLFQFVHPERLYIL